MPLCASCGQENPAIARFCLACGVPLDGVPSAPPPEEERKVVTALFTDIVGSTATAAALDPEDVRARLAPYYARVRRELEQFGGTVEKFIGDAVVALFGAPVAHEDDAERAVRAALAVRRAIEELNADDAWLNLHVRTAVHTGEALVVLGARAVEGEGMAAGDVMNTAARIQGGAPVDGIVVGEATYEATRERIEYREAEPVQAKGKAEPIPIWEVVAEKAVPVRPTTLIPLVGRTEELALLRSAWDAARETEQARLVTVLGAPGIGKSRLLLALCEAAESEGETYWGRCLPYGEGITYWPVIEILKSVARVTHDDDPAAISHKVGRLLERLSTRNVDDLRTMATSLSNLFGIAQTPRGAYATDQITQAELHWGIRRVLQLLACDRPFVLVLEDLHWAEPTLLELVRSLTEIQGPILVVASARAELKESREPLTIPTANRSVVELAPLDDEASRALLAELVGPTEVSGMFETMLHNAAGNPLFLEETVRMVADAKLDADSAPGDLPIPQSLQALVGSRLDALAADDKRVAQQAAVIGSVFWTGALTHLGSSNVGVSASLAALERRDFVRARDESTVAGEQEYAFKHIVIRDVAYDRLPKARRAELHVRFADWLAGVPGPEDEFVEILAYHLERACHLSSQLARSPIEPPVVRAVRALQRSAEKAKRREGTREAHRFFTRALELVGDQHGVLRAELLLGRARVVDAFGNLREAYDEYVQVADAARRLDRRDLRCAAILALANIDQRQGRAGEARPKLDEARTIAAEVGDRALQIRARFESANLRSWFEGDVEAAADELRQALALARADDDRALQVEASMRLGSLLLNAGDLADAETQLAGAATLAGEVGSFRDETRVSSLLAYVKYFRDPAEAERLALQAVERFERTCDSYLQVQNLRVLAKCALARGDADLAEERLREALPLALESGGWVVIEIYRYLVEALVEQERLDAARQLVAFAFRNLPEEDPYARAAALLAQGIVAAADREAVAAAAAFTEVFALLEKQRLAFDLGEARHIFARTLRRLGETAGAISELERARQIFVRADATALVEEIDRDALEIAAGTAVTPE